LNLMKILENLLMYVFILLQFFFLYFLVFVLLIGTIKLIFKFFFKNSHISSSINDTFFKMFLPEHILILHIILLLFYCVFILLTSRSFRSPVIFKGFLKLCYLSIFLTWLVLTNN